VGGTYRTKWEKGKACRLLEGKPEGEIPLGKSRRKLENNFKLDLVEISWGRECELDWCGSG
jgi:hypothetical protein